MPTVTRVRYRPRRGRWWHDHGTLVAAGALIVALAFNTIAACQSARESRRQAEEAELSRLDAQIGVLTSVSAVFQQTDVALARTRAERASCRPSIELTEIEEAIILRHLKNYDYLAMLFNQPTWTMIAAERYWRPVMLRALAIAVSVFKADAVAEQFPELTKFGTGFAPPRLCGR
jgi:hypothetical protein